MADQRRVFGKDIADLLGNSAIDLEPRFDENQLRAFMSRRHRRHGRPDTEFAGLVACRGDHTTSSRSPDSEGLTEQFRIVKHRAEHSVEENGSAILEENTTSVASRRTIEVIAAGKGRKPKPFMLDATEADAVWDSSHGLAADERMAAKKGGTRSEKGRTHQACHAGLRCAATLRNSHPTAIGKRLDSRN